MTVRASTLVEFTDRDVQVVSVPGGTWFVIGILDDVSGRLALAGNDPVAGARLATEYRNAAVVLVCSDAERWTTIDLWRGLYSMPDLYYATTPSGTVVVSDHVRNVVARLPVKNNLIKLLNRNH